MPKKQKTTSFIRVSFFLFEPTILNLDYFFAFAKFGDGKVSPNKPKIKDPKTDWIKNYK